MLAPAHTDATRAASMATVDRAFFAELRRQQEARRAAMTPAHRASLDQYAADREEARDRAEDYDPEAEAAFKGERFA